MHKHDLVCKDCAVKLGEVTFASAPDPKALPRLLNRQRCGSCAVAYAAAEAAAKAAEEAAKKESK